MATATEVRGLLDGTSLPSTLVGTLLDGASALWLMGEPAEQVAGDLALCHPALRRGEVRAIARPLEDGAHKVSVVAPDRPGLLAGTAGALAAHGLSITSASASTWPDLGLAVQRVVATSVDPRVAVDWDGLGADLRRRLGGASATGPPPAFVPERGVTVVAEDQGGGRTLVSVRAPDQVGLLWAIASWFEAHDCNIEVARVASEGDEATDTFVVVGTVDPDALATRLAGRPAIARPWPVLLLLRFWRSLLGDGWLGRLLRRAG